MATGRTPATRRCRLSTLLEAASSSVWPRLLQLREGGVVPCVYGKTSGLGVNFDGLSSRAYAQRTHVLRGPSLIVVDLLNQGLESVCVYLDLARPPGKLETTQRPSASLTAFMVTPLSILVTVTCAPEIAAPDGSTTTPPICPGTSQADHRQQRTCLFRLRRLGPRRQLRRSRTSATCRTRLRQKPGRDHVPTKVFTW